MLRVTFKCYVRCPEQHYLLYEALSDTQINYVKLEEETLFVKTVTGIYV